MKLLALLAVFLMGCESGNLELPLEPHPNSSAAKPIARAEQARFAMVSTPGFPGECLPGVVRKDPWGDMIATLPSGTLVWVGESKPAPDPKSHQAKKWWHVRFYQEGTPISGWMHGDILKPPVWKEPEAPIEADTFE